MTDFLPEEINNSIKVTITVYVLKRVLLSCLYKKEFHVLKGPFFFYQTY